MSLPATAAFDTLAEPLRTGLGRADYLPMGPTIAFVAGIGLLLGTVLFVNTTEGRRWVENKVETGRWITNQARPLPATAAPR